MSGGDELETIGVDVATTARRSARPLPWRPIVGVLTTVILLTALALGAYVAVAAVGVARLDRSWRHALEVHRTAADEAEALMAQATPDDAARVDEAIEHAERAVQAQTVDILEAAEATFVIDAAVARLKETVIASLRRQVRRGAALESGRQGWGGGTEASAELLRQRRRFWLGPVALPHVSPPDALAAARAQLARAVPTSLPETPLWMLGVDGEVMRFQAGRAEVIAQARRFDEGRGWVARAGRRLWVSDWSRAVRLDIDGGGQQQASVEHVLPARAGYAWLVVWTGEGVEARLEPGGSVLALGTAQPLGATDDHLVVTSFEEGGDVLRLVHRDGRTVTDLGRGYMVAARGETVAWVGGPDHLLRIRNVRSGAVHRPDLDGSVYGQGALSASGSLAIALDVDRRAHEDAFLGRMPVVIEADGRVIHFPTLAGVWPDVPWGLAWWGDRHLVWIEGELDPSPSAPFRGYVRVAEVRNTDGTFAADPVLQYFRLPTKVVALSP